jgi:hypothetical protein
MIITFNSSTHYVYAIRFECFVHFIPDEPSANCSRFLLGIIRDLIKTGHGDLNAGCGRKAWVSRVTSTFNLMTYPVVSNNKFY